MGKRGPKPGAKNAGRPRLNPTTLDQHTFEELCKMQCSIQEIMNVLKFRTRRTFETVVKRHYKKKFSTVIDERRAEGKVALRRIQLEHAKKSHLMAMFLGKQRDWLGQIDERTVQHGKNAKAPTTPKTDKLLSKIADLIEQQKSAKKQDSYPQPKPTTYPQFQLVNTDQERQQCG